MAMDANMVTVNGVTMTLKEYRKIIREKKEAAHPKKKVSKRKKKELTEINLLSSDINTMMKKVKLIRSLSAYYDNAYKQWGTIARDIINRREINSPFVLYRVKARELNNTINNISEIAKKNEKAIYQFIEKLAYQLDDLRICIDNLCSGISKSGVIQLHGDHECINGCGRRLGLQILVSRSWAAMREINSIIRKCQNISDNGVDPFDYTQETYNGMINCWSKKN